ncbi:DUF2339 domain-containing protein [Candidatus Gracilibacteria bacterium]|nr:DUF2339 domain-containing protein [Candidatus Gracilibacteria bacterium]
MSEQNPIHDLKKQITSLDERVGFLEKLLHVEHAKQQKPQVKTFSSQKITSTQTEKSSFEEAMGFTWFSRVGIVALVLGMVFFLKYAFDNDLINHFARIMIGIVTGVGLMVAGELTAKNEKYKLWAKKLVGGGFAITYFSAFAAYNFVEYREAIGITLSQDIILLSIITIAGTILGLKDDSRTFVSFAFFLGYLNAFLGIQAQSQVLPIIYCLFLTAFLITVSVYKQWHTLGIGGIVATYLLFAVWSAETNPSFLISSIFICSYYVAFVIQSLLFKENSENPVIVSILNSLCFYGIFYMLFHKFNYDQFDGLFAWVMTLISFALYVFTRHLGKDLLRFAYLALSLLFLTQSIRLNLNSQWITIGWALEAVFLGYIGVLLDIKMLRVASYIVAFFAASKAFFTDLNLLDGSQRLEAILIPAVSFYSFGIYAAIKKFFKSEEDFLVNLYNFYPIILVAGLLAQELESFYISIGWAVLAMAITAIGFILKQKSLRLPGIMLFALTILKVFAYDTGNLSPLYRMMSFLVLGVILLLVSFAYNKYKDKLKDIL